jgi:hypothetical protein
MTQDSFTLSTPGGASGIQDFLHSLARLAQQAQTESPRDYSARQKELLDALVVPRAATHSTTVGDLRLTLEVAKSPPATALAGAPIEGLPAVRVLVDGRPRPGVPVHFVVTEGGGRVERAEQPTELANGDVVATPGAWVLGAVGVNKLVAYAGPIHEFSVIAEDSTKQSAPQQQKGVARRAE